MRAGFPVLAGLDQHARVHVRQFQAFQEKFRHTLEMLRSIASLWNRQDPCIISGFDMDRAAATNALAGQPLGTFVCRFSMNQRGTLVLSVKVPATPCDIDCGSAEFSNAWRCATDQRNVRSLAF